MENINRLTEVRNQLLTLKIKVTVSNMICQSLFSIGGTLTDKKQINLFLKSN